MGNTFEESLKGLEKASAELKRDDITLDEALDSYEKGIKCYKECSSILKDTKQKIEVLRRG